MFCPILFCSLSSLKHRSIKRERERERESTELVLYNSFWGLHLNWDLILLKSLKFIVGVDR